MAAAASRVGPVAPSKGPVGTLKNPVVVSNLGIAAFHMVTIWQLGWPLAV
jgi:hypothetical protein